MERPPPYTGATSGKGKMVLSVRAWSWAVENYLQMTAPQLAENEKIRYAAGLLSGEAANWWYLRTHQQGFLKAEPIGTLTEFFAALTQRFEPILEEQQARDSLAALTQTQTVEKYYSKFLDLAGHIPSLTMHEALDRFMRGLKPEVYKYVAPWRPKDVMAAAEIATSWHDGTGRPTKTSEATPMELNKLLADMRAELNSIREARPAKDKRPLQTKNWRGEDRTFPNLKKFGLTAKEAQQLYAEGKCYKCREKGHQVKDCPN